MPFDANGGRRHEPRPVAHDDLHCALTRGECSLDTKASSSFHRLVAQKERWIPGHRRPNKVPADAVLLSDHARLWTRLVHITLRIIELDCHGRGVVHVFSEISPGWKHVLTVGRDR